MPQTINQAGIDLIKTFEGCKLDAYRDVKGVWTIGIGHTRGVEPGMHITQPEAEAILRDDLAGAEAAVNGGIGAAPTTANQFAAMVSLCFNIGAGNFRQSTVLRQHVAGHTQAAADAFLMWDKVTIDGVLQTVRGLANRRAAERALYLKP